MATAVDICNLALAKLGDEANVSSIDPPEGSTQAGLCARFYPIALNSWLEQYTWSFARARKTLAEVTSETESWSHAYAVPNRMIKAIQVLPPDVTDDLFIGYHDYYPYSAYHTSIHTAAVPVEYQLETLEDGSRVIYTDQEDAVLMYVQSVEDTTKFTPLFINSFYLYLASMIAGPLIRGDKGTQMSNNLEAMAYAVMARAAASDANQSHHRPQYVAEHLRVR